MSNVETMGKKLRHFTYNFKTSGENLITDFKNINTTFLLTFLTRYIAIA